MSLVEQLVKRGNLDKEKAESLEKEIKSSGKKEEEVILAKGIVSEDFLFDIKAEYLNIPFKKVNPEDVKKEVFEIIPEETASFYKMVPLAKKGNVLEVGMVYPEDLPAQEALKFLSRSGGFTSQVFLINLSTFENFLKQYKTLQREVVKALEELETELKGREKGFRGGVAEVEKLVEEAPITKMVATILRYAVEGEASDIHIEPTKDKLRIRFRLLGILHSSIFLPLRVHPAVISRIKILSNLKIDETRIPQDGRFSTKIENRDIDFRVSSFPTTLGEKVAIRVLDPLIGLKKIEDLGLEERNFEGVKKAVKKPYGMILASGPTGCGKTTTLYAILQILNKEGVNIVTLEDPVEYFIEGINQSQVRPEIGYSFSTGLRHIVRQDPDIIMVGEIRDSETASLATHAALTGHIVLSTLHTSNAVGVIPRLLDLGVQPFLIPPTISIALAQRLLRRLCDSCKKKVKPKQRIRDYILKELENLPQDSKKKIEIPKEIFIWEAKGCKDCHQQGFSGRIAIFEVMEMTPELADVILKEPSETKLIEVAKKGGMITMKQDGILKVLKGITTIEEVIQIAGE